MSHRPATAKPRAPDPDAARDLAWIKAIARGDRHAFEQLYTRYHGLLSRFLRRSTARHDLIEEVVNDSLFAVWRSAANFRGESKPLSWIVAIAYRTLLKALRDRPLEPTAELPDFNADNALASLPTTGSESAATELNDWVRHGLRLLPDDQRMTLELAYFLGQSCEEIADIMDCAVGTVKARMFHARVRLRSTLPALGGDADAGASRESA